MVFLFFPLLGVLIGLAAARAKGLGTASGVIGGLLLGPLAFLMFLCSSNKKRCLYCEEWIEKNARICPFCTKSQQKQSAPAPKTPKFDVQEKVIVTKTGDVHVVEVPVEIAETENKVTPAKNQTQRRLFIIPGRKRDGNGNVIIYCPCCNQKFSIAPEDAVDPSNVSEKFTCPECQTMFAVKLYNEEC